MTFFKEPCPKCGLDSVVMGSCFIAPGDPVPDFDARYDAERPMLPHVCPQPVCWMCHGEKWIPGPTWERMTCDICNGAGTAPPFDPEDP